MSDFTLIITAVRETFDIDDKKRNDDEYTFSNVMPMAGGKTSFTCICTHKNCKEEMTLVNKLNGKIIREIGSTCIKKVVAKIELSIGNSFHKELEDANDDLNKIIYNESKKRKSKENIENKGSLKLKVYKGYRKWPNGYSCGFTIRGINSRKKASRILQLDIKKNCNIKMDKFDQCYINVNTNNIKNLDKYLELNNNSIKVKIWYKGKFDEPGYLNYYLY